MYSRAQKILAITNQKGGVGKTTTAINLAASFARNGKDVLLIDLDPQGNASTGLGIEPADRLKSSYDLLIEKADLTTVIHKTSVSGLDLVPSTVDLSSADIELISNEKRLSVLRDVLRSENLVNTAYQYILIDCPPSLNLLTLNALVACDGVLIPLQSEFFALEGLSQLMFSIREIRQTANPDLRIEGILLTMYDARNNLSQQVETDARHNLGDLVFSTVIPRNVRLSEAPSFAMPVLDYDPKSKGAHAYLSLAREILSRNT